MSIEYTDGRFSETMPINEAMKKFCTELPLGNVKAFHVGSEADIEEVKRTANVKSNLADLNKKVQALTEQVRVIEGENRPSVIQMPNREEVALFGGTTE